uniref:Carbamoyl phosphate synthase small chain n=1 Tax=Plocamium cartilagineum TaxID=31452 RepID=A0A1C9CHT8_PLOCA|nr:carbamoyl-phosphate synthase arginine-specific small subunit [Plocamium cartilagineum]AOM67956.1 carbamoyl-phosphate synthase arginine-specific small subunit [Plocamium cartilagineum]
MNKTFYPAILLLEDGSIYKGWSFINSIISVGEIVFNTGMTGYQEIMTDPSYSGQIVTFTYPEIGNTGLNYQDNESNNLHIKGIIARSICLQSSNWRKKISLVDYLLINKIPHIFGIDTRSLTKHLRIVGVMNACISSEILEIVKIKNILKKAPSMIGLNLIQKVTNIKPYKGKVIKNKHLAYFYFKEKNHKDYGKLINIILIDFGFKQNILSRLLDYGCNVYILPATSNYNVIMSYKPDGILLSNGPGDPSVVIDVINTIKEIINFNNIPIFGICMGHQILSLALGAKTFKLKFGHRGLNHPTGMKQKSEITSQNHGFSVDIDSLSNNFILATDFNLNDSTVASILYKFKPILSVQYHPESSPGPHDSDYLFHSFIKLIKLIKYEY